ncbi:MAG: class I SAM-dependent methyltransferase [Pirellulaceae bacterium]
MSVISQQTTASRTNTVLESISPTYDEMLGWLGAQRGDIDKQGWRVQLQSKFGYVPPEMWYRAVVDRLVTERTTWIDVGGGKAVFPHSDDLTRTLVQRCRMLVGVDPSDNIEKNPFVHQRVKCFIEDYHSDQSFDLATLRMVAEHIREPQLAVASLARLVSTGGRVVIYTPHRWSIASIAASLIPQRMHSYFARFLWRVTDDDVFPTVYRMNTRRQLRSLFEDGGFREVAYARLDSCSVAQRFRNVYCLELCLWWAFRLVRCPYPESNLLGVYEKL